MTVEELIKELEQYEPDTKVHFAYNYGDHWKTLVAPEIESTETGFVHYSEYHRMDALTVDEEDVYNDQGELTVGTREVVVIR